MTAKPFLKWVGGKTQIIGQVMALFPTEIENYYEPFLGGGSVLLSVLTSPNIRIKGAVYASDYNEALIHLYKNIQKRPKKVIEETRKLIEEFESCDDSEINRNPEHIEDALTSKESYYYWIRKLYNNSDDISSPKVSAMFIFLNKTGFRGIYRVGPNGYNVPYGNNKSPQIIDEKNIMQVSKVIKDVEFKHVSYTEVLPLVEEGDFVYMDPPYAPETGKSFVSYTKSGFKMTDHSNLFEMCLELPSKFLLSNANVEMVRNAFETCNIETITARRAINSKRPGSTTTEVLIYN